MAISCNNSNYSIFSLLVWVEINVPPLVIWLCNLKYSVSSAGLMDRSKLIIKEVQMRGFRDEETNLGEK